MRHLNIKVYDDWLLSSAPAFTREELDLQLGQYDLLGLFVVADNVDASGNISVQIWHSGDGRLWIERSKHATALGSAASNEINVKAVNASGQLAYWGYDLNALPSLRFVRLKIFFGGGASKGHVRVYVTARDRAHAAHGHHVGPRALGALGGGGGKPRINLTLPK